MARESRVREDVDANNRCRPNGVGKRMVDARRDFLAPRTPLPKSPRRRDIPPRTGGARHQVHVPTAGRSHTQNRRGFNLVVEIPDNELGHVAQRIRAPKNYKKETLIFLPRRSVATSTAKPIYIDEMYLSVAATKGVHYVLDPTRPAGQRWRRRSGKRKPAPDKTSD